VGSWAIFAFALALTVAAVALLQLVREHEEGATGA
jgi:hypothetical protein